MRARYRTHFLEKLSISYIDSHFYKLKHIKRRSCCTTNCAVFKIVTFITQKKLHNQLLNILSVKKNECALITLLLLYTKFDFKSNWNSFIRMTIDSIIGYEILLILFQWLVSIIWIAYFEIICYVLNINNSLFSKS